MINPRPPVVRLTCDVCAADIQPNQVLVYYDSSGRDGDATDPAHLACYLRGMDSRLPSNRPIRDHVKSVVTFLMAEYLD